METSHNIRIYHILNGYYDLNGQYWHNSVLSDYVDIVDSIISNLNNQSRTRRQVLNIVFYFIFCNNSVNNKGF